MRRIILAMAMTIMAGAVSFTSESAFAFPLRTGTYEIGNHSGATHAPPGYGLRLDGLLDGDKNKKYTFDFDDARSDMKLTYDGSSIHIFGQSWGGRDTGSEYSAVEEALWDIDFVYDVGLTTLVNGGFDDIVYATAAQNFGSISSVFGDWGMTDFRGRRPYSFNVGDEGGAGHRGEDRVSGWGWVNHFQAPTTAGDSVHLYSSGWLFTVLVAEPLSLSMFALGLLGLAGTRRRNK